MQMICKYGVVGRDCFIIYIKINITCNIITHQTCPWIRFFTESDTDLFMNQTQSCLWIRYGFGHESEIDLFMSSHGLINESETDSFVNLMWTGSWVTDTLVNLSQIHELDSDLFMYQTWLQTYISSYISQKNKNLVLYNDLNAQNGTKSCK